MIYAEKEFKGIRYCEFKPNDFNESKKYPIVFFVHGAGTRGDDLSLVRNNAIVKKLTEREKDAVIIAPQCKGNTWFDVFESLIALTEHAYGLPFADKDRFYIAGNSMGGYTSYQLMMSRPNLFAAGVVCCGGGMYWNAERLKDIPLLIFHGLKDNVVFPCESEHMAESIVRAGGNAKLTLYPECDHNSWDKAFDDPNTLEWLFEQRKKH